uniref:Uncharacterized protein n=1 Tax=Cryptomonas curvata TaxID=233186 RepID=A0A7S0NB76_9CRYP|mmetsp:Transcript_9175/g.19718  ORF Transcript_9175/g.19718 Transcript_9175/m.19718 type:complete len:118 (+) Transcript_9175:34-387(+)
MEVKRKPKVVGQNVVRAARLADSFAVADQDVHSAIKLAASAKWSETQQIRSLSNGHARHREKEAITFERESASTELLTRRMQRMKELYTSEHAQYALELASLGLTIADTALKGAPYC